MRKRQWFAVVFTVLCVGSASAEDAHAQLPVSLSFASGSTGPIAAPIDQTPLGKWRDRSDELPGISDTGTTLMYVAGAAVVGFVAWKVFASDDDSDENNENESGSTSAVVTTTTVATGTPGSSWGPTTPVSLRATTCADSGHACLGLPSPGSMWPYAANR